MFFSEYYLCRASSELKQSALSASERRKKKTTRKSIYICLSSQLVYSSRLNHKRRDFNKKNKLLHVLQKLYMNFCHMVTNRHNLERLQKKKYYYFCIDHILSPTSLPTFAVQCDKTMVDCCHPKYKNVIAVYTNTF